MRKQLFFFAIAGTIGFLVDAGMLYLMLKLHTGPYIGRLISFLCAVFVTWQINRQYTFAPNQGRSLWREWNEYLAAMAFGGACNYGIYVLATRGLPNTAYTPLIAVALGSVTGMVVNFVSAKLWVYGHRQTKGVRTSRENP
ncbi:GtrA family protein [Paraburkholderia sp. J63]|uniref:GtrA family protein n=1 Tax=Paraburkholderia sp. J63 TaxID=2805434 RepID=UPI002ABD3009|nr:GtrA family protein [Paraburkholderia sp. J63]